MIWEFCLKWSLWFQMCAECVQLPTIFEFHGHRPSWSGNWFEVVVWSDNFDFKCVQIVCKYRTFLRFVDIDKISIRGSGGQVDFRILSAVITLVSIVCRSRADIGHFWDLTPGIRPSCGPAPSPVSRHCESELSQLCGKSRTKSRCITCAEQHRKPLAAAGCTNKEVDGLCGGGGSAQ